MVIPASLGRRLLARALDLALLLAPAAIVGFVISRPLAGLLTGVQARQGATRLITQAVRADRRFDGMLESLAEGLLEFLAGTVLSVVLVALVTACCYEWLFHALRWRTPGQFVAGVRVVRSGRTIGPGPWLGLVRTLTSIGLPTMACAVVLVALVADPPVAFGVALALCVVAVLGLVLIFGPSRRCLHDRCSGTEVVQAARL
jgi:type IV secretory pathway VirB2 component (pilin)